MNLEILAGIVALAVALPAIWVYNGLVGDRNLVRQGFADIDVQLKRRTDLVPQLVEAVRGYAGYEKALLTTVAELRSAVLSQPVISKRFEQEKTLGEGLKQVLLLQENYPQLKADTVFRDLSARLVGIEDALQAARRFYNGAVKQYQTRIESFPDMIVAKLLGFQPMPYFAL